VIVRRERPHPARSCRLPTSTGTASRPRSTDLAASRVELDACTAPRANAEDRVRAAKQTGLENLPFREFALNASGSSSSLIAQDLSVWTQSLCLDGELASCEPQTLRYRLLHTAARLAFHARRATLRLQPAGPGRASSPPRSRAAALRHGRLTHRRSQRRRRAAGAQAPKRRCRETGPADG
jgi:hypothetical protein